MICITETEKAYAAGLFDGEGSITISPPRKNRGFGLAVEVGQKNPGVLYWLKERWGGCLRKELRNPKDRESFHFFHWSVCTQQASLFLNDIFPYSIEKRRQIEVALEFQSAKRNGRRLSPENYQRDQSYQKLLKKIKSPAG